MLKNLAFVFPGQGSQFVGMLSDFATNHPIVIETFSQASDVLNYDLWKLVCEGPAEKLNQTEYTQPALMAADVALWRAWCETHEEKPALLAGHSLGEFVALVCANALDYETAVSVVAARGRFMQEAVPAGQGAMAAIVGLDDETINALCQRAANGDVVSAANFNSIGQVVIAGHTAAVERAMTLAKTEGAKIVKQIPVSAPSHCALMQPAADQLEQLLSKIKINPPTIPVIQNSDAQIHRDPTEIRQNLVTQLILPVRWVATIQTMQQQGITDIIECGPGKVLQGLIKRISPEFKLSSA